MLSRDDTRGLNYPSTLLFVAWLRTMMSVFDESWRKSSSRVNGVNVNTQAKAVKWKKEEKPVQKYFYNDKQESQSGRRNQYSEAVGVESYVWPQRLNGLRYQGKITQFI